MDSKETSIQVDQVFVEEMIVKAAQSINVEAIKLIFQTYPDAAVPDEAIRSVVTSRQIPLYDAFRHHDPNVTRMSFYDGRET